MAQFEIVLIYIGRLIKWKSKIMKLPYSRYFKFNRPVEIITVSNRKSIASISLLIMLTGCQTQPAIHSPTEMCQVNLPTPLSNSPVALDNSQFLLVKGYELPDYASFSFGQIYDGNNYKGWPGPEIKAVADLNNDGRDDLIIDYYETEVPPLVLLANGNGTFSKAEVDPTTARRHIRNGEVADFNNDGLLDFAGFTTGDPGQRWVAQGHSTNGKSIPRGQADLLMINQGGRFVNKPIPEIRRNDWNHGGSVGDIDNDGFIDILPLSEGENERTVPLINKGDATFELGHSEYGSDISRHLTSDLDVGDFNGDGFLDIAVIMTPLNNRTPSSLNKLRTVRVIFGDGDFDFSNNKKIAFGGTWLSEQDVNKWKLSAKNKVKAGYFGGFALGTSSIKSVDLNDDGLDDLLVGHVVSSTGLHQTAGFTAYVSNGDCFADATSAMFPNQTSNRILNEDIAVNYIHGFHLADINSDGLKDLVLQSDGANDGWYRNNKEAGHPYLFLNQGGYWLPIVGTDSSRWANSFQMVPGDFDGDGHNDLAFIQRYGPDVVVNVSLNKIEALRENGATLERIDWSRDQNAGEYEITWAVENVNDRGVWIDGATDTIRLREGVGDWISSNLGLPGNPNQRNKMNFVYDLEGNFEISGTLGLFKVEPKYKFVISGQIEESTATATWAEGDRIRITVKKKNNK